MDKILFINACARLNSRTLSLAKHLLGKIQGEIEEVDLYNISLSPLDSEGLEKRENAVMNKDYTSPDFDLAKQFSKAQIIVIASPYWDLTFPAILKTYLEAITVSGITFRYGEKGRPVGLCNGKKLYYVTTAGGPVVENLGFGYVDKMFRTFYGIKETECFMAEGLDIVPGNVEKILSEAKKKIDLYFEQ